MLSSSSDVAATPPGELAEVGSVGDAEVLERHEEALVDRLPEPQLDGDALVEPLGDVLAVEPLGRRGEPEQLLRLEVLEQPVVGRAAAWWNSSTTTTSNVSGAICSEPRLVQRLDHREDVPPCGDPAAAVDLAERRRRAGRRGTSPATA